MVPVLRTPGATSAAKPPFVAVMVPRLTIEASGRPGMLKLKRPAMKSPPTQYTDGVAHQLTEAFIAGTAANGQPASDVQRVPTVAGTARRG